MKTFVALFVFLFLMLIHSLEAKSNQTLREFRTDYCTLFPEGTQENPDLWAHCCFAHDLRYWFGGSMKNRDEADLHLRACVAEVARKEIADLIYDSVKAGHLSPIKHKFSWGWGWRPVITNRPLTRAEKKIVHERLWEMDLDPELRQKFIRRYL